MKPLLARARAARLAEPPPAQSDEDLALEVLRAHGGELLASELVEELERRGWRSRCRSAGRSLGNKLTRDPRFASRAGGYPNHARRWRAANA